MYLNESGSKTVSTGVSYGNNALGMHASYDQSDNFILSNTHTNSEINSEHGTFSLTTDGDTNIKGGNIVANVVDINIGGDLNMATMQDTYEQQGSSFGIGFSGGIGGSGSSSAQGGIPASVQNVNVSAGVTDIYRQTTGKATGIVELSTNDSGKSEAENLDNLLNSGSVNVAGNIDNQTVKENVNFTDANFEGTLTVPVNMLTEQGREEVKEAFVNLDNNLATVGTHIANSAENIVDSVAGAFNGENQGAGVLDTLADKQIAQTTQIARSRDNRARDTLENAEYGQTPENIDYALTVGKDDSNKVYSNSGDGDLGFYDTQNKQGYVNLGENALNEDALVFTDAHETAHSTSNSEAYANMIGGGAVSNWNTFSSINSDYYQSGYSASNYGIMTAANSNSYQPTQAQYNIVYNLGTNRLLNVNTVAADAVAAEDRDELPYNQLLIGAKDAYSKYGIRENPVSHVIKGHFGVDTNTGNEDKSIHAAADGVVKEVKYQVRTENGKVTGWGNTVLIENTAPDGQEYTTRYAHMADLPDIKIGDTVTEGQVIGEMGATGGVTGPHLHF